MFFQLLKALRAVRHLAPFILELIDELKTKDDEEAQKFLAHQIVEAKRLPEKRRRGG